MTRYYLSKNYNGLNNAGNKAKTDIEETLSKLGYKNAGLPQTTYSNKIAGFFNNPCRSIKSFVYSFCQ